VATAITNNKLSPRTTAQPLQPHHPQLCFPKHLIIIKKNQEKGSLHQKILRMISPVQQEDFTGSTWESG